MVRFCRRSRFYCHINSVSKKNRQSKLWPVLIKVSSCLIRASFFLRFLLERGNGGLSLKNDFLGVLFFERALFVLNGFLSFLRRKSLGINNFL